MAGADKTHWDAIVIGSGIGGMAAAAALSKVGHKVLLLEQYQTLGGQTHSFTLEGFTGMRHPLPQRIAPGDPIRDLLDWLSDTPMEFTPMGAVYDNLHIGDAATLALSRPFEAQERDFKDRFPDEAKAIEAWTAALREGREAMQTIFPTRAMSELLGHRVAMVEWPRHRTLVQTDDAGGDRRYYRQPRTGRRLRRAMVRPWRQARQGEFRDACPDFRGLLGKRAGIRWAAVRPWLNISCPRSRPAGVKQKQTPELKSFCSRTTGSSVCERRMDRSSAPMWLSRISGRARP